MEADQLRRGVAVSRGEFRLDEARAREKLQNFQLPNPHFYILEFVKAASLFDATTLQITVAAGRVELVFDGVFPTVSELVELYSPAFSRRRDRREQGRRHLALGVNAAGALGLRELRIEVGGDNAYAVVVRDGRVEALDDVDFRREQMRIVLTRRLAPALLPRFVSTLFDGPPEVDVLRERARFSELDISVNGARINNGFVLPPNDEGLQYEGLHRFGDEDERGLVGVVFGGGDRVVYLLQHGVLVSTEVTSMAPAEYGVCAVVESFRLTPNLSQSAFVEDLAWAALERRISEQSNVALAKALTDLPRVRLGRSQKLFARLVLATFVALEAQGSDSRALAELMGRMEKMTVFERACRPDGKEVLTCALRDLCREVGGATVLYYSGRTVDLPRRFMPENPVLFLPSVTVALHGPTRAEPIVLRRGLEVFADEVVDVSQILPRRVNYARRWENTPYRTEGLELRNVHRRSIGAFQVVVGQLERSEDPLWEQDAILRFVKDDHLLGQQEFESNSLSLYVEIEADARANLSFDGFALTSELHQAQIAAAEMVGGVLQQLEMTELQRLSSEFTIQRELQRIFRWRVWPDTLANWGFDSATESGTAKTLPIEDQGSANRPAKSFWSSSVSEKNRAGIDEDRRERISEQASILLNALDIRDHRVESDHRVEPEDRFEPDRQGTTADRQRRADPLRRDHGEADEPGAEHSQIDSLQASDADLFEEHSSDEVDKSPSESSGAPQWASELLRELHGLAPEILEPALRDVAVLTVVEEGGDEAARLDDEGRQVVIDGDHPAVAQALRWRRDSVARAMAFLAIYRALERKNNPVFPEKRRRFVDLLVELSAGADETSQWSETEK